VGIRERERKKGEGGGGRGGGGGGGEGWGKRGKKRGPLRSFVGGRWGHVRDLRMKVAGGGTRAAVIRKGGLQQNTTKGG